MNVEKRSNQVSRREFFRLSAIATAGTLVAACGSGGASEPAPTAAPEAAEAAAPAAQPVSSSGYNESPMWADLVAKGELPPIEERLPETPLTFEVVEEIGTYGGVWRRAYSGVSDHVGPTKLLEEYLVMWAQNEGGEPYLYPRSCESYEVNEDASEYTWHLRRGTKWSDGVPLTTEDVRFWYEDLYMDESAARAVGGGSLSLMVNGEKMEIEIVDEFTFKTKFVGPNPLLPYNIAAASGSHGNRGPNFTTPSHYMKQFHPKYAAQEDIDKVLAELGLDEWDQLFETGGPNAYWFLNPEVPTIGAWLMKVPPPGERISMERNPYYYGVDTAGNQLPYIDTVTHDLFDNVEVLNFKIINGEIDCQYRHVNVANFTLFKENEAQGDYRILLWKNAHTYAYQFNLAYANDDFLHELFNDIRFRHAMSVAIDRDEINNLVFNGLGEVRQASPVSGSPNYDAEWETKWIEYDPDLANQLLDEIGLTERDSEGFRLRPDGEVLTINIEYPPSVEFAGPATQHELVQEYWQAVGVKISLTQAERALFETHISTGEFQANGWVKERSAVVMANPVMYVSDGRWAGQYGAWYSTQGAEGIEPPADHPIREVFDLWDQVKVTASEEERNTLFKQLMDINKEQIWSIGVVGETPAIFVVKNNFRNVPNNLIADDPLRSIGLARPAQFFMQV